MGCHGSKLGGAAECEAEMISYYQEACRLAPELRSAGVHLVSNVDPSITRLVQKSPELLLSGTEFLKISVATIQLLDMTLRPRLEAARSGHSAIRDALRCHDKDDNKFRRSFTKLKQLVAVKNASHFSGAERDEFGSVLERSRSLLRDLDVRKHKLGKRVRSTKAWRKAWRVLHNAAFLSVLVGSVALAAAAAPPFAVATATVASTAMKAAEQWLESLWTHRLGALNGEKDMVAAMWKGSLMAHELESVRAIMERLEILVGSVLGHAEFAMVGKEEEAAMALEVAMVEMEKKVGVVAKTMDEMEKRVDFCRAEIQRAVAEFSKLVIEN